MSVEIVDGPHKGQRVDVARDVDVFCMMISEPEQATGSPGEATAPAIREAKYRVLRRSDGQRHAVPI